MQQYPLQRLGLILIAGALGVALIGWLLLWSRPAVSRPPTNALSPSPDAIQSSSRPSYPISTKPKFAESVSATKLHTAISEFIEEEQLTEEEAAGFLVALYDAQQNLGPAGWDSDEPEVADIRADVYGEFAEDLLGVFGPERLADLLTRWNLYLLLFKIEDAQALALE